jgi:protocatechuate 3,4-dioxygenase, beta subunit
MNQLDARRQFLKLSAVAGGSLLLPQWTAAQAAFKSTEPQMEGPYYPVSEPRSPADFRIDTNNDLTWVNGKSIFALGTLLELYGRVLDPNGRALRNIEVQVWQCDNYGRYHHPGDVHTSLIDNNFQGFGRSVSNGDGRYFFRTIKPVAYPGRTPHLHLKLKDAASPDILTTQMYIAGDQRNASDGIYQSIPINQRSTVTIALTPPKTITLGGLPRQVVQGTFNIVLGTTPRIL